MKKLIFTLLFSTVMFSSPSFAKWTNVGKNVDGNTFYVDFDRIRKHDGYVYYWTLFDYLKPTKTGTLSGKNYQQVDCQLFRVKDLSVSFHKKPMGGGTGDDYQLREEDKKWIYPSPESVNEFMLKKVCSH